MPAIKDLWDCAQELLLDPRPGTIHDLDISRSVTGFTAPLSRVAILDVVDTPGGGFDVRVFLRDNPSRLHLLGSYSSLSDLDEALTRHQADVVRGGYVDFDDGGDEEYENDFFYGDES